MKILLIDDSKEDRDLILKYIKKIHIKNDEIKTEESKNLKEAFHLLAENTYDAIILDLKLPESEGVDTINKVNQFLKKTNQPIPIIIITGLEDYKTGRLAFDLGVKDFLIKDEIRSKELKQSLVFATYYNGNGYTNGNK